MKYCITLLAMTWFLTADSQPHKGFQLVDQPGQKQVAVLYDGQLLTAYCYTDSIAKPFLYPVNTLNGITVTRGFPVRYLPGESTDHPHHVGIWLNYESVNGIDFWNNSSAIPASKKDHYGSIIHQQLTDTVQTPTAATLKATATWVTHS